MTKEVCEKNITSYLTKFCQIRMDKQFDRSDLNKIGTLEKLLIDGANNKKIDDTLRQRLELELSDLIDCQALVEELKDLPFALKVFNANSTVPIKK